jgi:hypothetical protein
MRYNPALKMRYFHKSLYALCTALIVTVTLSTISVRSTYAQSLLDIRGSISFKIAKGRLSFKIGEVTNLSTSGVRSGQLEVALWLSRTPYYATEPLRGAKLASCSFEGIVGGETIGNASCQARLRFISRGKYYVIITLSEFNSATNSAVVRDSFTFSKRLKL